MFKKIILFIALLIPSFALLSCSSNDDSSKKDEYTIDYEYNEKLFKVGGTSINRSFISELDFIDASAKNVDKYIEDGYINLFDVTLTGEGKVILLVKTKGTDYSIKFVGRRIYLPEDSTGFFSNLSVSSLDLDNVSTSRVIIMENFFYNSIFIRNLDISNMNTTNVTNFSGMFMNLTQIRYIDVDFSIKNALTLKYMFKNCYQLITIDFDDFVGSRVVNIEGMFYDCYKLVNIDLDDFKPTELLYARYAFWGCSSINDLNIKKMDFYNMLPVNIEKMFYNFKANLIHLKNETNHDFLIRAASLSSNISVVYK
ncbi:MAG: BspA family leucine-rich repeat surface protein [Anaeroplasmataceae bacterium]